MPLPKKVKSFADTLSKGAKKTRDKTRKKVLGDLAAVSKALKDGEPGAASALARKLPVAASLAVEGTGKLSRLLKQAEALAWKHDVEVTMGSEEF
jgi:hypothetical protein